MEEEEDACLPFQNLSYIPYGSLSPSAPYVDTPISITRAVAALGSFNEHDVIVDLGCGGGDFLNALLSEIEGVRGIGIDFDAELVAQAQHEALNRGIGARVEYWVADLTTIDPQTIISRATKIYTYLVPGQLHHASIKPLFQSLEASGLLILSYKWAINYLPLKYHDVTMDIYVYGSEREQ
eukprot:TRINITY_DN20961_c0_g1_i2.p1 TRINITY_DN20961_c0_g1~~TRINITY_DN20961_c0_g1_i2.p1  ORF type:complete len:199 (+),score=19.88 TRINITY_DN20961_c0_g1_i2:56-598(+)